jgi:hypothetical protein
LPSRSLHLLDDNDCLDIFVEVPLEFIQCIALVIGPTYIYIFCVACRCYITLLPLITVNREIGLVIHHPFVDRFSRENVLSQELQPNFDDGLLTCCGLKCNFFGFAVDSYFCQKLFVSVVMNLDLPPSIHDKILYCCLFFQDSKRDTAKNFIDFMYEVGLFTSFLCKNNPPVCHPLNNFDNQLYGCFFNPQIFPFLLRLVIF